MTKGTTLDLLPELLSLTEVTITLSAESLGLYSTLVAGSAASVVSHAAVSYSRAMRHREQYFGLRKCRSIETDLHREILPLVDLATSPYSKAVSGSTTVQR